MIARRAPLSDAWKGSIGRTRANTRLLGRSAENSPKWRLPSNTNSSKAYLWRSRLAPLLVLEGRWPMCFAHDPSRQTVLEKNECLPGELRLRTGPQRSTPPRPPGGGDGPAGYGTSVGETCRGSIQASGSHCILRTNRLIGQRLLCRTGKPYLLPSLHGHNAIMSSERTHLTRAPPTHSLQG